MGKHIYNTRRDNMKMKKYRLQREEVMMVVMKERREDRKKERREEGKELICSSFNWKYAEDLS